MQTPELSVHTEHQDERIVLKPVGEIDAYTAPLLREGVLQATSDGATAVVVDLRETGFIDSTGLGVLITGLKSMKSRGGSFEIVCSDPSILKILDLTGLSKVFEIHESLRPT